MMEGMRDGRDFYSNPGKVGYCSQGMPIVLTVANCNIASSSYELTQLT